MPGTVSWREENHSQLVEVIIKNKKNRLSCKTTEYSMLLNIYCTRPVQNFSFVLETQDLPKKINSSCIFFLTKNYCLCVFNFGWNYFEVYSFVKFLGRFRFKTIFWSQTVSGRPNTDAKINL